MSDFPSVFHEGRIFLVDKPLGWTSFDAVAKIRNSIRKFLDTKKIKVGHAGTLDPMATGLLVICTGRNTKKIPIYQEEPKTYTGQLLLGKTTPSFDTETDVDAEYPVDHIQGDMIQKIIPEFLGEVEQLPPIYSALKKDGRRSYELARKGKEVVLDPRPVYIYELEITDAEFPFLSFRVKCSKGTYIRSLVRDIGLALKSGAYMTELRRTDSGGFSVDEALSPEDWAQRILSGTIS
jgi:tRNA pseudouridine55 synthase